MTKNEKNISARPPIVTILGHVDHGKTTLLDAVRKTRVAQKEAGGITQAIGASQVVTKEGKRITFIDTPGHAAFKEMRSRGAKVADIAILVVAADDGVQPQTKEALAFIKEAQIPFIVAVTKVDLATANVESTLGQLEKEDVFFEKRGGEVPWVAVSARTGLGIDELMNLISLIAEVNEINGNPEDELEAVVIETSMGKGGNLVNTVVRNGSISVGEILYFDGGSVKVRNLLSDHGPVKKILPGEPVQILGFEVLPPVGSKLFSTVFDDKQEHIKKESVGKLAAGEIGVFIKSGNAGSLEAVLGGIPAGITVIGSSVGDIFESDVLNAKASNVNYIFAFEAGASSNVGKLAEAEGIKISSFKIIYELFQALEELVKKGKVEVLGKAEIVGVFPFNNRKVAGSKVISGRIGKTDKLVLMRGDIELGKIKAISMKKQKQEIALAGRGEEFGMIFEPQFDFAKGDVILSVTNNG
ncbi:MAG: translation initiation factor IF-2 [Candidatus Microgenomates bacterium]|jgi:translation initiation factor IF-2